MVGKKAYSGYYYPASLLILHSYHHDISYNNNETRFDTLVKAFECYLKIGGDKSGAMIEARVILKVLE